MKVSFGFSFKRAFKKRIKDSVDLETRFWQKLEQFTVDPFAPSLKTPKLSGKLKEFWSFSVDYDERVLFYFIDDGKAVFVDIGTIEKFAEVSLLCLSHQ